MTPIGPTKPRKAELSDYSAQDIHDLIWARNKGAPNIYELLTQRPIYRLNRDAWFTKLAHQERWKSRKRIGQQRYEASVSVH